MLDTQQRSDCYGINMKKIAIDIVKYSDQTACTPKMRSIQPEAALSPDKKLSTWHLVLNAQTCTMNAILAVCLFKAFTFPPVCRTSTVLLKSIVLNGSAAF